MTEYSDEEVFGQSSSGSNVPMPRSRPNTSQPREYSDAEVFGGQPTTAPQEFTDGQVFAGESPSYLDYLGEMGKAFVQGGVEAGIASPLKGLSVTPDVEADNQRLLELLKSGVDPIAAHAQLKAERGRVADNPLYQAGAAVSKGTQEFLAPKDILNPIVRDVASGVGSVVGNIATLGVGTIPAGMGESADRVVAFKGGMTQEQEQAAVAAGSIAGATDLVDVALPMLGTTGKVVGLIKRVGLRVLQGAIIEGGQEGLQQFIQNLIAKGIYDPTQDLTQDVAYNALIGAIVGGGVSGVAGGHKADQTGPTEEQLQSAAAPPVQEARLRTAPTISDAASATPVTPPITITESPTPGMAPPMSGIAIGPEEGLLPPDSVAMPNPPVVPTMFPQEPPTPQTTTQVEAGRMDPEVVDFLGRNAPPLVVPPTIEGSIVDPNSPAASSTTIQSSPGANLTRLAKLLGPQLYDPSKMTSVSVKEILQNSFDAVKTMLEQKQIDEGKIDIRLDDQNRTVTVTDNGSGMAPEVLGKQFLEIAGTKKETTRASGGFGIAKMLFLFGNKSLHVLTMRNGKVSELSTTGRDLFSALEDKSKSPNISVRDPTAEDRKLFPKGHGTSIEVTVPTTYQDSATGEEKSIPFERSEWQHPVLQNSPLFDNIDVKLNGRTLQEIGKTFPYNAYTQFSNVKFDWGTARIYVSKDIVDTGSYESNLHVLSNGLWQFSTSIKKNPREVWGENVKAKFYVDLNTKVNPEEAGYPLALNRQQFSKSAQEDFNKIFNYLSLLYQAQGLKESAENFGDMQYLEYSPTGVVVGAKQKIEPKSPPPPTALTLIRPGDKITVHDGQLIVNGRKIPELTPKEIEQFKVDPDALRVPQDQIDPHKVILHDNMTIKISELERKSLVDYAREKFGKRFDEYVFSMGNAFKELRDVVAKVMKYPELLKEGIGVSFDKQYFGVSIRVPFHGMFLNTAIAEYTDPLRASVDMVYTMVHELAHHKIRGHDASFPNEMQRLLTALDVNQIGFNFHAFKQKVVRILNDHQDIFQHLNGVVKSGNFDIQPRGKRLEGVSSDATGNGSDASPGAPIGGRREGPTGLAEWVAKSEAIDPTQSGRSRPAFQTGRSGSPDPVASLRANQSAINAVAPQASAVPQQPETGPIRDRVAAAFDGATPPELREAAAHADKMNRFYKYAAGLDQLADANPRFTPLLRYTERVREMHNDESKIQDAALRVAKDWRRLGSQSENLTALIDDVTNMVYLTLDEQKRGVQRHPTQEEFNRLVAKHKVSGQALEVYSKIKTMFATFLTLVQQNSVAMAQRMITDPVKLAAKIDEINAMVANLQSVPYFPFMNFGRHFVTLKDPSGSVLSFETFERQGLRSAERRQMARVKELVATHGESAVRYGVLPEASGPMIGMPQSLLADIKNDPDIGLTPQQREALDMLVFMRTAQGSFAQRFKQKNYTPGYSMDFRRAFARYFFHGARFYSRTKYMWALRDAIAGARSIQGNRAGNIADYMDDHLRNNILDYTGDFGMLKGAIFLWALGYVPAAATQNLTQTPMITLPFLSGKFGEHKAVPAMAKAMTKLSSYYRRGAYDNMTDFEFRAMGYGIKTGRISETQAPELAGMSQGANLLLGIGGNRVQRGWIQFQEKAAWMFEMAEQFNRRVAYRAALDLAMKNPSAKFVQESVRKFNDEYQQLRAEYGDVGAKAVVTAAHTVDQTQYVYARYARPRIFRGRLAGTLFVFKKYMQSTLFMLAHNKSDVLPRYLLVAAAMGGLAGLPGYDDLRDIIRALGMWLFKKDFNLDREIRRYALQFSNGKVEPDLILHGLARRGFGVPAILDMMGSGPGRGLSSAHSRNVPFPIVDRSKATSMGNILPFEVGKLFQDTKDDNKLIADQTQKASGAVFSVGFNIYKALMDEKNAANDFKRWENAVPRALASASRSYRAFTENRERSKGGIQSASTIINYDPRDTEQMMEALALAGGYQPLRLQAKWDSILAKIEVTKFYDLQRDGLLRQLYEARAGGIAQEMQSVQESIRRFNSELPDWARGRAITPDMAVKSMEARARERLHREAGVPTQLTNVGISRHIDTLFPEATVDVRRVR